jgi:hypothetical protein
MTNYNLQAGMIMRESQQSESEIEEGLSLSLTLRTGLKTKTRKEWKRKSLM